MTTTKKGRAIQEAPLLLQRPREEPPPGWSINPAGWRRNKGAQAEGGCKHYSPPLSRKHRRASHEKQGVLSWGGNDPSLIPALVGKIAPLESDVLGGEESFQQGDRSLYGPINVQRIETAGVEVQQWILATKPCSVGDGPFQQCNEWNQCVETGNIGVYRRTVATRRGPCTAVKIGSWRVVLDCFRD